MKTIFFISLLFVATLAFPQKKSIDDRLENLYDSDYFKSLDLLVKPEIYLPAGSGDIVHIAFKQDTANSFHEVFLITAGIDKREGFENTYSIGTIYDYMTGERQVGFHVEVYYADGSMESFYRTIHFDQIIPPAEGYKDAQYLSTEYWEYDGYAEL